MLGPVLVATFLAAFTAPVAMAQDQPDIEWEVVNRFRLFGDADISGDPGLQQALADYDSGAATDSRALYAALLTRLSGPAAEPLRAAQVDSRSRPAVRGYADDYLYPEHYTIRVHTDALPAGTRCRWRVGEGAEQAMTCSEPVELDLPPRADASGAEGVVTLAVDGREWSYPVSFDDRLVVAMGDSYMSGEGNPDVPSALFPPDGIAKGYTSQWPANLEAADYKQARWWDEPCHRSLLSWPVLATLMDAVQNRQEAVSLVHLACSGASVHAGLARPQEGVFAAHYGRPEAETMDETWSQVEQLEALLAAERIPRRVDDVYLSAGGNDVGFAGVVTTLLTPPNGWRLGPLPIWIGRRSLATICAYDKRNMGRPMRRMCSRKDSAEGRFASLPDLFDYFDTELHAVAPTAEVHLMAVPNPLVSSAEKMCITPRLPQQSNQGFESLISTVPAWQRGRSEWQFQLQYCPEQHLSNGSTLDPAGRCDDTPEQTDSEVCQGQWVWSKLRGAHQDASTANDWTLIDAHLPVIRTHGVCNEDAEAPLRFPRWVDGEWRDGVLAADFDGYRYDLPRWFRTTNDSVLMQYQGPEFTASNISGTIHPTFRAHLEMALAARQR